MRHCVVTLDLVSSRRLQDRKGVQEELKEVLKVINDRYLPVLEVPFNFTLGDEVQGVMYGLSYSYRLISDFQRHFSKHLFYAGVGFGEIVTDVSERSGEMDGPAFHLARASVEELKKTYARVNGNGEGRHFTPLVRYMFDDAEVSIFVNRYLQLVELLKYSLTDKQQEVYWLLDETGTYSEIAGILQQSKSAITQKVQAGHLEELKAGEEGFIALLEWIEKKIG